MDTISFELIKFPSFVLTSQRKVWTFQVVVFTTYNTIQYNSVYLMCSEKLMDSQLSLAHDMNKEL